MDSNLQSPFPYNADSKTTFRKPSTDAANRNYWRHIPVSGSSSSDEILKRDPSSIPNISRDDRMKVSEYQTRRKDDGRGLESNSRRSYSRSGDSYRHSDGQSFRGSHGYSRHDDYVDVKRVNEEERNYKRLSSCSGREAKDGSNFEHTVKESEQSRLRDYSSNVDKYSRDKYDGHGNKDKDREGSRYMRESDGRDEKRDYHRNSGDYRGDRLFYEGAWAHRNGSTSGGNSGNHHLKDAYKSDSVDLVGQRLSKEEMKKNVDREIKRYKGQCIRESIDLVEDKSASVTENQEFPAKKPKLHSPGDEDMEYGRDVKPVSKFSSVAEDATVTPGQNQASDSNTANDLNAAKVAAIKAAELVNRNLVGVGSCITTDQKKKLLWGNKKNTTAEESGHHWDTTLFSDRERQEKFNKLMSLRLHWYPWPIVGCEERLEVGAQTQQPGCGRPPSIREAERTPAGFGKAVHCWTPTKGRSYRWIRSLSICYGFFCTLIWCCPMLSIISLYNCGRVTFFVILYLWDIWEDMHCCWDFSDLGKKRMVSYDISNPDALEFPSQVFHKPYLISHYFRWLIYLQVQNLVVD